MNKQSDIENDVQLIHMIKAGDKSAFGKLYYLHQNRVRAIVGRYVQDREETEDLMQVVFMKVFQSLRHFRGESAFTTWANAHCHQRRAVTYLRSRLSPKKWYGNHSAIHARTSPFDNTRR